MEGVRNNPSNILEKTALMKLLGYPPINVREIRDSPVFFRVHIFHKGLRFFFRKDFILWKSKSLLYHNSYPI